MKNNILLLSVLSIILFSCKEESETLKIAISPYQDIAMVVNIDNLGLEKKYNLEVDLLTMNWEDILPSIASAGKTADIGFGSYIEYLTKYENINKDSKDPILFIYPAYIFKGGGFITFNDAIVPFNKNNVDSLSIVKSFFSHKIGAQKNSVYEMMLYSLANRNNISIDDAKIFDTPLNDGLLATQNGSLEIAAAGLTQITEAKKHNGRVILTMEDLGFADITGFICKRSTLEKREKEIKIFLKMWFECVDYVFQDLENNSKYSLQYLNEKAATKYTFEQYKTALSQEYFPKNIQEANKSIVSSNGLFSYKNIQKDAVKYLIDNKIIKKKPMPNPFLSIDD